MANKHGKYIFENAENQYLFKLLVIGDSSVGKSALLSRFSDNIFTEAHVSTLGTDFRTKIIKHEDDNIKLQIWDTTGQERYNAITSSSYRKANGVIIVYDVTNANSFENIRKVWLDQIEQHADEGCKKMLVGNKVDLVGERSVSYEKGAKFTEEMGMPFSEASAKNDQGVADTFEKMCGEIKNDMEDGEHGNVGPKFLSRYGSTVVLNKLVESRLPIDEKKGGCC